MRMAVGNTKVVQVTNIAPQATKDQMQVLFGYLGKIEDIRLYPTIRDVSCPVQSRICYIKFVDASTIPIAQHMTNTVFIDRALIVIPFSNGEIPDEYYALEMTRNGTVVPGLAVSDPKLPPHVVNSVHGSGEDQVILTTDTNLDSNGLPPYPPLPANFDSAKIEETRRTVVLLNYDPAITSNEIIDFFNAAGEVKYLRTCKRDSDDSANMLIEFSDQPSVVNALKMNGMELKGKPVDIQHATQPITKPQAKSNEAAQKEIEEAMSRFKEAQNMINASIEPVIGMLTKDKRSSRRSRSRSRGRRRRSRSRSRSRRSRSRRRRSTSRRRSRSRDRKRRTKSRSRKRSSSRSRRSVSRSSKSRRSRSKSRTRSRRKSKERSSRVKSRDRDRKSKDRDRSRERKRSRDRKSRDRDASKERDKEKDKEKSSSEPKEKRSEKDRSDKDKSEKDRGDKDKSEKDRSDKDKSEKDRSDKDKSDKDRSDKDKSDKDRSDKDKSEKDRGDREKSEKDRSDKEKSEKERSDKESSVDVHSEKRVSRSRSRSKRRSRSRDRKTRDRKRSRSRGSRRRSPSPRVSRKRKSRSRSRDRDRKRDKKSDRRDRDRREKDRKSRSRSRSRRSPSRRSTRSHSKVPRNYDEEERGFDSVKEKEAEPPAPEKGSPEKSDNMDISNSP